MNLVQQIVNNVNLNKTYGGYTNFGLNDDTYNALIEKYDFKGSVSYNKDKRIRCNVQNRDARRFVLTGKCEVCGNAIRQTIRHHKYYPSKEYDPNAIMEVCTLCHERLHKEFGVNLPITND